MARFKASFGRSLGLNLDRVWKMSNFDNRGLDKSKIRSQFSDLKVIIFGRNKLQLRSRS